MVDRVPRGVTYDRAMRLRVLASVAVLPLLLASCGDDSPEEAVDTKGGPACEYNEDGSDAAKDVTLPPAAATVDGEVQAAIETSAGPLNATMDAAAAPCTVGSFVSLAEQGYFDATKCHRLTTFNIFVLQCGDPTATGTGGPGYTIPDELAGDETYPAGTLAMAKTSAPDSGGSQFFVVYEDTTLPPEYTVFGTIDEASTDVVRDVAAAGTETGGPDGAPKTPVEIESVTIG